MDDIYGVILEQLLYQDMIHLCQTTNHMHTLCNKNVVIQQRLKKIDKRIILIHNRINKIHKLDHFWIKSNHPLRYYDALVLQLNMTFVIKRLVYDNIYASPDDIPKYFAIIKFNRKKIGIDFNQQHVYYTTNLDTLTLFLTNIFYDDMINTKNDSM